MLYSCIELTLDCGHIVYVKFQIRKQYPDDQHYVMCPPCRPIKTTGSWKEVKSGVAVSVLPDGAKFIMPRFVLRLQPSVPKHRIDLFPYVTGVKR